MILNEINNEDTLNFAYVVDLIKEQMEAVMSSDYEFYSQYIFEIVNEQYFVPNDEREANRIFIVIKFSPAQIDYGQNIMPLTIQAVSECNGLAAAQRLLLEYAQFFNLNTLMRDGYTIYQNYTTPNVISNFEIIYDGYRSVLIMSGTILLSNNINRITLKYYDGDYAGLDFGTVATSKDSYVADYIYYDNKIYKWNDNTSTYYEWDFEERAYANVGLNDEKVPLDMLYLAATDTVYVWDEEQEKYIKNSGEEIDILNFSDTFDASPNTQPYFNNHNFTDSVIKYGTYSFNISSYLMNNVINNKVLNILSRKKTVNNNFYFKINFDNDLNMPLLKFKMISANKQQNKGEMPVMVIAFTN